MYYGTADDLVVLPENDPAQVESLARWLGFDKDLDRWFTLEKADPSAEVKVLFPTPCTVRKALTCYCDINGAPSKQLVSYLACYAEKSDEVGWISPPWRAVFGLCIACMGGATAPGGGWCVSRP